MTKIQLIAFDLDGTVLPILGHQLSPRFVRAIQQAHAAGIPMAVFTGRSTYVIPPEVLALQGVRYISYSNGAGILDRQENWVIYQSQMPEETCLAVLALLEQYDVAVQLFTPDLIVFTSHAFANKERYHFPNHHMEAIDKGYGLAVEDLVDYIKTVHPPVDKINLPWVDEEVRAALLQSFAQLPGVDIVSSGGVNLEINACATNKGLALAWLAAELGISMENVMAIGDNDNDVGMLLAAGVSVAVANGTPQALAAARHTTASVEADGAALAIEQLALGKLPVTV